MDNESTEQTPWFENEMSRNSYRSIFRWGDKNTFYHPRAGLVEIIKRRLKISPETLLRPRNLGLATAKAPQSTRLNEAFIQDLRKIVGDENIQYDDFSRIRAGYGKAMIDNLRLREEIVENIPDLVLHPRNEHDVQKIINYCNDNLISVYVVSGRSSVTRGFEAVHGGVTLDMSTHFHQVIKFSETNQTITVQPGIYGPDLENMLKHAKNNFLAKRNYTCGHFPQSFEYSTVGGWISARSAGQNSTYYGKIEDIVTSQKYISPTGIITTNGWPRAAIGPDLDQVMTGSEGAFGILVEATLKIFRYMPENKTYFSYMFKSWEDALDAARKIMQAEAGCPSVFRISDPEETDVAMHLYKIADSLADKILKNLGYHPMKKCLMLGNTDGEKKYSQNMKRVINMICRNHGALNLSMFGVAQRWEHNRFLDPYIRDDLLDFGVIIDTLECSVTWERMQETHSAVRKVIKDYPNSICMTHISHAYPQGGNLYFIFLTRHKEIKDYLKLQYSILDEIQKSGAAMSHHHGLGKHMAPWLPGQVGSQHMAVLTALKKCFDPNNILNPGGTLGLDMSEEQRAKKWGL